MNQKKIDFALDEMIVGRVSRLSKDTFTDEERDWLYRAHSLYKLRNADKVLGARNGEAGNDFPRKARQSYH